LFIHAQTAWLEPSMAIATEEVDYTVSAHTSDLLTLNIKP